MNMHPDWNKLYGVFLYGNIKLIDLAKEYNVSYEALRKKASLERWSEKRKAVNDAALALMEARTSEEVARRNLIQAKEARAIQSAIAQALADDAKQPKPKLLPKSFEDVYRGMSVAISLERTALGLHKTSSANININRFHYFSR